MFRRNLKTDPPTIDTYLRRVFNSNNRFSPSTLTLGRTEKLKTYEETDFEIPFNDILSAHKYLLKQFHPMYSYVNQSRPIGFKPVDEGLIPLAALIPVSDINDAANIIEVTNKYENNFIREITHFFYGEYSDKLDILETLKRVEPVIPKVGTPPTLEEGATVIHANMILQRKEKMLLDILKSFDLNSRVIGFNQPKQEAVKIPKNLVISITEFLEELVEYEDILLKKIR